MRIAILLLILATSARAANETKPSPEQLEFFESKVRPILVKSCYKCHSVEEGKSKGGLTLDTRPGWQKGGEHGQVIEPGMPEASPLIQAIRYRDPDLQMPPKGQKLDDAEIATLVQWVKMGAPDPRDGDQETLAKMTGLTEASRNHWAYQPVRKPEAPRTKNPAWCQTPLDAFVLAKLEENGMRPNPPASKPDLLRRAYYDLIGLPPSPSDVQDFLRDTSPEAFEKVVDKLLAMPQYGERWGRHWLDTARYSDTIGGDRNANRTTDYRYPNAWTYRDYVIQSLNEDKPYDQFVMEQLAADLLPGISGEDRRLAALGFLTVGERFRNPNDIINDRIDTLSKGFLGLTVACARCHDHKFDPIPTQDFYALHGIFASIYEPDDKPVLAAADQDATADFQKQFRQGMKELRDRYYAAVEGHLQDFWSKPEAYLRAAVATAGKGKSAGVEGQKERNELIKQHDLDDQFVTYLSRGLLRIPSVWGPLYEMKREGRFEVASLDKSSAHAARLSKKRAENGKGKNAATAALQAQTARPGSSQAPNRMVAEALRKSPPETLDEMIMVYTELLRGAQPQARQFIQAMKDAKSPETGFDEDLTDLLRGPFAVEPAPLMTRDLIEANYLTWQPRMQGKARLNFGELNLLETSHPGAPAHAMVVTDKPNPKNSPVYIRGEVQSPGPIVPRGFLEILSPNREPIPFTKGSGRLELAQSIASPGNPLTARVAVNRMWMHHFGEGFVSTPDDMGVQSGLPTHPELLDYLAAEFMSSGWSMKAMHRLIMASAVYQQSSKTNAKYEVKDPMNHLLWRANLRRLDFEAMRDSLLVFSGELDKTVGGKPVNLTDEPYSYRRSVYGYIDRGNLPELMQNFDFSDPDMANSKRAATTVPQQALFLMNSSMAVDISRKLVARPEVESAGGTDEKVRWIYQIVFQRLPSEAELDFARSFLEEAEASGGGGSSAKRAASVSKAAGKAAAAKAAKKKESSKFGAIQNEGEIVSHRRQTAWEAYAQALLFSNEIAYVN